MFEQMFDIKVIILGWAGKTQKICGGHLVSV